MHSISLSPKMSSAFKGKQVIKSQNMMPSSSWSSGSTAESSLYFSDNEDEEYYFSDASSSTAASTSSDLSGYMSSRSTSAASLTRSTSPRLGDFVLDDEDSALYFAAAASASLPAPQRKVRKSTRKGTSSLFFSAAPVTMPVLSTRLAMQNPSLQAAAAELADRLRGLSTSSVSSFQREDTLETDETHQQWERALMFANFQRDSRTGTWTPPEGTNAGLQRLIAAID